MDAAVDGGRNALIGHGFSPRKHPRLKPAPGAPESTFMSASHFVLLIESDEGRTEPLAAQLVRLGVEPVRVEDLDEALALVKSKAYAICAVILPTELAGRAMGKALKAMRRREPVLPALAYGKRPSPQEASDLRRAGVLLSLWDGYDEGMVRFQLNRLVAGDGQTIERASRRAPTHTPVQIHVGGREKQGILYSVSRGGCFIETPRASMDGARLRLVFALGERAFELDGHVVFANVPGNLQRPNLPLGMGVRFEPMPREAEADLETFIEERVAALEV